MEGPQNYELSQVPLDDLLLALEATKSSVDLSLSSTVGHARLSVHQGKLDDASFGDQSGPEAVLSMLSLRDGRYELSAKSSHPTGLNASLAQIVQQKMQGAGPLNLSRTASQPPMHAKLERTGVALPRGLKPIELRTLALVNGSLSPLDIVAREEGSPAESLQAVRNLVDLKLIQVSKRGTLALGTRIPVTATDTLHSMSSAPARSPHAGASTAAQEDGNPGQRFSSTLQSAGGAVPARLRRSGSREPRDTGYSSVPPPSLAEERVKLPNAFGTTQRGVGHSRPVERSNSGRTKEKPVVRQDNRSFKTVEPIPSGRIQSVLNAATVVPDDGLHVARTFTTQAPQDTISCSPAPLGGSSSSQGEYSKAPPTPQSPGAPRPRMDSDEIGPDPLVVDAAKGQLRDSELPLPSSRLGPRALSQLDELNEAVGSSRKPKLPSFRASKDATGDILTGELVAPGSVPNPDTLPGAAKRRDSDLPVVGRYEILARLKRGGMGSVYMCRLSGSAGFRRHFAMKVLHGHLAQQGDALDAFFHEARVLGGLHHRNIVGIADVGTPSEPYFVLEYVEGGSLAELYRATREGRDPGLVVSVILDALNGLEAAHQATDEEGRALHLVHCDVTPHNLLVGIDGTCRVTDFGIARTNTVDAVGEVTRGKPGYVAPERLERGPSDHRSDIFSLGVVLYAGLTGCEPFAGETPDETMRNVLLKPIVPPSEVGFRPPPSLDWVCMKALARDPKERFQSAEEMANQLRRIAGREGFLSSPTDVAAWVSESLAPTLAARRAAAMRGTASAESRYRPSTIPPGVEDIGRAPAPSPSAAESTGPLEAPASSHGFRDKTETLSLEQVGQTREAPPEERSRVRQLAVYGILGLAVGALVWVALSPNLVAGFLRVTPPAGQASGLDKGVPPSEAAIPASAAQPPKSDPPPAEEDQDGIVIPDIVPPGSEK